MKDPQHPAGPAFDAASNAAEAARQLLAAALTEAQRRSYENLKREQQKKEQARRDELAGQERQNVADKMRRRLLQKAEFHYEIGSARMQLTPKQAKLVYGLVDDHLAGRETSATAKFRAELTGAEAVARQEVAREQSQTLQRLQADQQRQRDGFLERCRQERHQVKDKFNEAVRDPLWRAAFEKAARQEAEQDRHRDRDKDLGRSR